MSHTARVRAQLARYLLEHRNDELRGRIRTGIQYGMSGQRKVTVVLPGELLAKAQRATGESIAPTIRRGLELVAATRTYEAIRRLRGKGALLD